ncbi:MAG: alpha/beta hydrolase [Pseudomonadota bacterium]
MSGVEPKSGELIDHQSSRHSATNVCANPAPKLQDPRTIEKLKLGPDAIELEVMDYAKGAEDLRPLLILSPIDFPFPPSVGFCEFMKRNGFRVIYIRRRGFGGTPALPDRLLTEDNFNVGAAMMAEVAVIMRVIAMLKLENIVLLGVSSANSICYRLCQFYPKISLTVFSHPIFNQDTFATVRPVWLQPLARQTVLTKAGCNLVAKGLRFKIKRNPILFYDQFYSKSSADLKYREENEQDFVAAAKYVENITPEVLFYEVFHTLAEDPFLRDGLFFNIPSVVLAGNETTETWLANAEAEAMRLGVPFEKAPRGGILTAYSFPKTLLRLINERSGKCHRY